jgi:hypothetical protein
VDCGWRRSPFPHGFSGLAPKPAQPQPSLAGGVPLVSLGVCEMPVAVTSSTWAPGRDLTGPRNLRRADAAVPVPCLWGMRGKWAETWDDGPLDGVIAPPSIMYGSSYFVAQRRNGNDVHNPSVERRQKAGRKGPPSLTIKRVGNQVVEHGVDLPCGGRTRLESIGSC